MRNLLIAFAVLASFAAAEAQLQTGQNTKPKIRRPHRQRKQYDFLGSVEFEVSFDEGRPSIFEQFRSVH